MVILCHKERMKDYSTRIGLYLMELAQWIPCESPSKKTQTVPKNISCPPETDSKRPLVNAIHTQFTKCEDV